MRIRHWDIREFDEYIAATEATAIKRRRWNRPAAWKCGTSCFPCCRRSAPKRRFLLFALDGLSYEQIAQLCGCSKYAVWDSVEAVRKKYQKLFKDRPHETPFSG